MRHVAQSPSQIEDRDPCAQTTHHPPKKTCLDTQQAFIMSLLCVALDHLPFYYADPKEQDGEPVSTPIHLHSHNFPSPGQESERSPRRSCVCGGGGVRGAGSGGGSGGCPEGDVGPATKARKAQTSSFTASSCSRTP